MVNYVKVGKWLTSSIVHYSRERALVPYIAEVLQCLNERQVLLAHSRVQLSDSGETYKYKRR